MNTVHRYEQREINHAIIIEWNEGRDNMETKYEFLYQRYHTPETRTNDTGKETLAIEHLGSEG